MLAESIQRFRLHAITQRETDCITDVVILPLGIGGQLNKAGAIIFSQNCLGSVCVYDEITNLVNKIFETHFLNTNPRHIRYFEHYPKPISNSTHYGITLAEWQEVIFLDIKQKHLEQSATRFKWTLRSPRRYPVNRLLRMQLSEHVYT